MLGMLWFGILREFRALKAFKNLWYAVSVSIENTMGNNFNE